MASSQLFSFVQADSLQVRTHSHSSGNDQESHGAVSSKAEMGKPNTVPRFDGFYKGFCCFSAEGEFFFIQGADFAAGKGKQHAKFKRENSFLHWPL